MNNVTFIDLNGKELVGDLNNVKGAALATDTIEKLGNNYKPVRQAATQTPASPIPPANNMNFQQGSSVSMNNAAINQAPSTNTSIPSSQEPFNAFEASKPFVSFDTTKQPEAENPADLYKVNDFNNDNIFDIPASDLSAPAEPTTIATGFGDDSSFSSPFDSLESKQNEDELKEDSNNLNSVEQGIVENQPQALEGVGNDIKQEETEDFEIQEVNLDVPDKKDKKKDEDMKKDFKVESSNKQVSNLNNHKEELSLNYDEDDLEYNYDKFKTSYEKNFDYVNELRNMLAKTREELYLKEKELEEYKDKYYSTKNAKEELTKLNELAEQEDELNKRRIEKQKNEIEEYKKVIQKLEEELKIQNRKVAVFEEKENNKREEIESLQEKVENQKGVIANQTVEINALKEENNALKKEKENLEISKEMAEEALARYTDDVREREQQEENKAIKSANPIDINNNIDLNTEMDSINEPEIEIVPSSVKEVQSEVEPVVPDIKIVSGNIGDIEDPKVEQTSIEKQEQPTIQPNIEASSIETNSIPDINIISTNKKAEESEAKTTPVEPVNTEEENVEESKISAVKTPAAYKVPDNNDVDNGVSKESEESNLINVNFADLTKMAGQEQQNPAETGGGFIRSRAA